MDLEEAKRIIREERRKMHEEIEAQGGSPYEPNPERLKEKLEQSNEIFDSSECQPHLLAWMFDIHGRGGESAESLSLEELGEIIDTPQNLERFIAQKGGGLYAAVKAWLGEWGALITDAGGGSDGAWDLGCYCTSSEARRLYLAFREHFSKALQSGLLDISLKPWALGIPEDYRSFDDDDEGEEWKSGGG